MALLVCVNCTARYSVGAPRCPQCQSTNYVEEGQDMPKVTVHGGPSNEAAEAVGGEESSPGSSSETSSESESSSPTTSEPEGQSPARKTASRSGRGRTGASTAHQTGGAPTGRTSGSADA